MTDEHDPIDVEPTEAPTELATIPEQPAALVTVSPHPAGLKVYDAMDAAGDWAQMMGLAQGIWASGLAPASLKSLEAIGVVLLAGKELGMGAMEALQNLHVVKGKIGMDATKMRARVYERIPGADIEIAEASPTRCELIGRRPGKSDVSVVYTIQDAKTAKLTGKDNWQNHPADMLVARATSRLVRRQFPDALGGAMYTRDELENIALPPSPAPEPNTDAPQGRTRGERAQAPNLQAAANACWHRWYPFAKAEWQDEDDPALIARFKAYVNAACCMEVGDPATWTQANLDAVTKALDASDDPRPVEPSDG